MHGSLFHPEEVELARASPVGLIYVGKQVNSNKLCLHFSLPALLQ